MSRFGSLAAIALCAARVAHAQAGQMGQAATTFTVRIENVSTPATLKLSNGTTAPAPTAPVLWVVHTVADPVFARGKVDRGLGLEHLAEDGDPAALAGTLGGRPGIVGVGAIAVPVSDTAPGPITPGKAYELTVTAAPGQKLTLAFMFGQSNDLFYAPEGEGMALFDGSGKPIAADLTSQLVLWDAGTEANQEAGLGSDQAPRQKMANTGASERKPILPVLDQYTYPSVSQVIRVTVAPQRTASNM